MKKTILVVEDEVGMRNALKSRIERAGYDVILAANGKEGLRAIEAKQPDLIISDVMMPVMDGFEFYKELKSDSCTKDIPVLILTARAKMRDSFLVIGVDSFASKPFEAKELLEKIANLLKRAGDTRLKKVVQKMNAETLDGQAQKADGKRILVGGSIELVVDHMKKRLEMQGCQVEIATGAKELLRQAVLFCPALIVMEVQMDTISAGEVIYRLREISNMKVTILLYSYFSSEEHAKDTIVSNLYSYQVGEMQSSRNQLVEYIGYFTEETFWGKIKKYI